jgi:hypothetical protein
MFASTEVYVSHAMRYYAYRRNIAKSDTPSRYINDRLLSGLTTDILRKTAGLSTFGKSKPPSLQN